MTQRRKISAQLQTQIRQAARYLCEYCHTDERWQYVAFTVDHVIPVQAGGANTLDNYALACFHCNRRKADKTTVLDTETGQLVALFNPRQQLWADHFSWSADGLFIVPLTAIGQVTVNLLELNRERVIQIRAADILVNRHPPTDDPKL